jgi:TOMM system kinase/cyclase fusion protein
MDFYAVLDQVIALLRQRRRVTYRALKRQFALDDATLEDLKAELFYAHPQVRDDTGQGLVWVSDATTPSALLATSEPAAQADVPQAHLRSLDAERRQLTVLFCDLVDSTRLAGQLDPEDYREVVRAYQATCAEVIQRFEGYIAQYLGDGLLVYFGYPQAHEDDARRAVHAGLGIVASIQERNTRLAQHHGVRVAVRIGIHTGIVVVGEVGSGTRQEHLAMGETPNVAARLQGQAEPDTIVISAATFRLVRGYFTSQDLGAYALKGMVAPVQVYHILGESAAQSRLDVAETTGFTPLVGRDAEVELLLERWAQSQSGMGQVVLLCGEAGIGKSRLVEGVRERVLREGATRIAFRCSPYYQNSVLYPIVDHLQRFLHWHRNDTPEAKFDTLERVLQTSRLPLEEVIPLFAALLSVPLPVRYPPLSQTPQQQRHKTHEALVAWLLEETERQPVLAVWEDLQWADPSTLEVLSLVLDQAPTARMLTLLTCRPEFRPPWASSAPVTHVSLTRLGRSQVEAMLTYLTGGKALPAEVVEQVVAKTDGVPLFVEELVKMILESGLVREEEERYVLTGLLPPLAIPSTLHDSLMARLDRLSAARELVQLGAVLGREFSYEVLQAVAPLEETTLQYGLAQIVDAELVYQRGLPPRSRYVFKHALIQDAAYQSLLKSTRQQYHQRIAQVLEAQFPETVEMQPELLAHHYTEAGLNAQAVPYWQQAGERARQHSANAEAIAHLTNGLVLLKTLPETLDRTRQELDLQTTLGPAFMATRGYAAPDVAQVYTRARELCQQMRETSRLFPVLWGLWMYHFVRAELQAAYDLGKQCLSLAQHLQNPTFRLEAHRALGTTLFFQGELPSARSHLEQGITFYDSQQHRSLAFLYGQDPKVTCLSYIAWVLWLLGYPDQALQRGHEALSLAQELAHPFTLALALQWVGTLHQCRREAQTTQERAETVMALARQQGFIQRLAGGTMLRGWALAMQGARTEGIAEMRQGLATYQTIGAGVGRTHWLALLAEAYGQAGQTAAGLAVVADALGVVDKYGEPWWEAELHRLKGALLLGLSEDTQPEVETCFQQALAIACRQQAKSLELRVAMSLARLWQQQGKRQEAYDLLTPIYDWFTEGFDTADLQEARALLEALA